MFFIIFGPLGPFYYFCSLILILISQLNDIRLCVMIYIISDLIDPVVVNLHITNIYTIHASSIPAWDVRVFVVVCVMTSVQRKTSPFVYLLLNTPMPFPYFFPPQHLQ